MVAMYMRCLVFFVQVTRLHVLVQLGFECVWTLVDSDYCCDWSIGQNLSLDCLHGGILNVDFSIALKWNSRDVKAGRIDIVEMLDLCSICAVTLIADAIVCACVGTS